MWRGDWMQGCARANIEHRSELMKSITFSADEQLIEAARERARAEHTGLSAEIRRWLVDYAQPERHLQRYDALIAELRGTLCVGRKFTRDEMNER